MSKRPSDLLEPAAKKRTSNRQLTKDDPSDDEVEERGTIQTASEDVLRGRKIVKARRGGTGAPPPTPTAGVPVTTASANPFAGVSLVGSFGGSSEGNGVAAEAKPEDQKLPAQAVENKVEADRASTDLASPGGDVKQAEEPQEVGKGASAAGKGGEAQPAFASFASSTAPFAAKAGTVQGFSFGKPAAQTTEGGSTGSPGIFSFAGQPASSTGFSFAPSGGAFPDVQSIFGTAAPAAAGAANGAAEGEGREPDTSKPALSTLPPEAATVTGEEDEENLWRGDGTLYEFDGAGQWRERGKGELRVNSSKGRPARFIMRHRGFLRLLMNANLWPGMKVTPMDGGKGATFQAVNSAASAEGGEASQQKLQTFAFRLKQADQLHAFISTINAHKSAAEETEGPA